MAAQEYTLSSLAELLKCDIKGDPNTKVNGLAPISTAQSGQITFFYNSKLRDQLKSTQASIVMLAADELQYCETAAIITSNPYLAYAKVSKLFAKQKVYPKGKHATAVVGENCDIHESVSIGPNCVIGNNVDIAENAVIRAGCVIGDDCVVGADTLFYPNVTLYDQVRVGMRVIIHAGVVVGSDGFGNAKSESGWQKIAQLGGVIIGDDVEVGANTTIDCGSIGDTVIGNGVKLDNQIQVAHNVQIGDHTAVAGCTGIAGSTVIGKNCIIAGGVSISDHIEIADNVTLMGTAVVFRSISEPGVYGSGVPLLPFHDLVRLGATYLKLPELRKRVAKLEKMHNE